MEESILVHKAIYSCSCTKEYLTAAKIPKRCPQCFSNCALSRVQTFQAVRNLDYEGKIYYPECGK